MTNSIPSGNFSSILGLSYKRMAPQHGLVYRPYHAKDHSIQCFSPVSLKFINSQALHFLRSSTGPAVSTWFHDTHLQRRDWTSDHVADAPLARSNAVFENAGRLQLQILDRLLFFGYFLPEQCFVRSWFYMGHCSSDSAFYRMYYSHSIEKPANIIEQLKSSL